MNTINSERLAEISAKPLGHGKHEDFAQGMCVMEAVSWIAGEPWSDEPACTSPAVGAFMRSWNDGLPTDADRNRLLFPLIPAVIGTRTTDADEQRRAFMAMDWLVRVWTPKWLELVPALKPHAVALRECEEICDAAGLVAATWKLNDAGKASAVAGDAAWDAAWAAAWAAAGDAARSAAWAVAEDAAWAAAWAVAGDAAGDAAWAAAGAAAGDAAWAVAGAAAGDAAGDAIKPTVEWCQTSATDLVQRMCAVGRAA